MPITFGTATFWGLVELVVLVEPVVLVECAGLLECAEPLELGGPLLENSTVGPVTSILLLVVGCGLVLCLLAVGLGRPESGLEAGLLTLTVRPLAPPAGSEWWRPAVFSAPGGGWVVLVPNME